MDHGVVLVYTAWLPTQIVYFSPLGVLCNKTMMILSGNLSEFVVSMQRECCNVCVMHYFCPQYGTTVVWYATIKLLAALWSSCVQDGPCMACLVWLLFLLYKCYWEPNQLYLHIFAINKLNFNPNRWFHWMYSDNHTRELSCERCYITFCNKTMQLSVNIFAMHAF